jgi:hypothetical protein
MQRFEAAHQVRPDTRTGDLLMSERRLVLSVPAPRAEGGAAGSGLHDPHGDSAALLAAADSEADALADRLHDGVLQSLVVARYATDAAVRGADPAGARDAVQEALVALRRLVWQLRPRGSESFPEALAALSGQRTSLGGAPLDVVIGTADADAGLCGSGRALAYRLVQAAVADPGPVRVAVQTEGRYVTVSVTGSSTAAAVPPAVWDARARALGGRFEAADPGSRTTRLLLPACYHEGDR